MIRIISSLFVAIASVSASACSSSDIQSWSSCDFTAKLVGFSKRNSTMKTLMLNSKQPNEVIVAKLMPKALEDLGLSTECSTCYVKTVVCAFKNCSSVCAKSHASNECKQCNLINCMPALLTCVGPQAAAAMPREPDNSTLGTH